MSFTIGDKVIFKYQHGTIEAGSMGEICPCFGGSKECKDIHVFVKGDDGKNRYCNFGSQDKANQYMSLASDILGQEVIFMNIKSNYDC